jgi:hypothetical protein
MRARPDPLPMADVELFSDPRRAVLLIAEADEPCSAAAPTDRCELPDRLRSRNPSAATRLRRYAHLMANTGARLRSWCSRMLRGCDERAISVGLLLDATHAKRRLAG